MNLTEKPNTDVINRDSRQVLLGIVFDAWCYLFVIVLVVVIGNLIESTRIREWLVLWFIWAIGLTQWAYIMPLVIILRKKGRNPMAKGMCIGGAVMMLLNASCYLYFSAALRRP